MLLEAMKMEHKVKHEQQGRTLGYAKSSMELGLPKV